MNQTTALIPREPSRPPARWSQELIEIAYRRRHVAAITFAGIVLGALLLALVLPKEYESEMKVLVTHDRADAIITPGSSIGAQMIHMDVTEEDLNTEVQLIKSEDLLEKAVVATGLDKQRSWLDRLLHPHTQPDVRVAVDKLAQKLSAVPVKKSNMIEVTYRGPDPGTAQRVLATVSDLYVQKHTAVHHPPGASEFFEKQAEQFGTQLHQAEARLEQYSREHGVVSATAERDNAMQQANQFEAQLQTTESSIRELHQRIADLQKQVAASPARIITANENVDAQLLTELRTQLTKLELQHTEMLAKYDPNYRPVKDLEAQIAQVRNEIAAEEKAPVRKVTTDNNPTSLLLQSELAKSRAELAAATARAGSLRRSVADYRISAFTLNDKSTEQTDLLRDVKAKEQQYLLYLQKRDEARIADALDSKHLVNVAIAQQPTLPFFSTHSRSWILLLGICLACMASTMAVVASEHLDHRLHTARDIEAYLEVPVLAALPKASNE